MEQNPLLTSVVIRTEINPVLTDQAVRYNQYKKRKEK